MSITRRNQYDGVEEYWIDVRTTGSATYSETSTEKTKHEQHTLSAAIRRSIKTLLVIVWSEMIEMEPPPLGSRSLSKPVQAPGWRKDAGGS